MFGIALLLVLCSGFTHALWNLFAKQSTDKAVFLWAIYMPSTIGLLPVFVVEGISNRLGIAEWLTIAASAALQAIYALLLAQTYKAGDLSQVYPIMRGLPTLLTPAAGVLILGESLPPGSWIGIACMLVGFFVMVGWGRGLRQAVPNRRPAWLAIGVGLCISAYTLIDKVNLGYLSPLALLGVANLGFILGLTPAALGRGRLMQVVKRHGNILWLGAILSPGSYLLFLCAASQADLSLVAPLREVGIVFGAALGFLVLKEAQGARRIAASVAIVTGIVVLAAFVR
ncbi:EamA family transporter [Paenibacillaceae bacterium WGS1546]|uniref:EamA family transporter n=1 Tax=Cohnella sp. WGS1546 TaxID=3366810 RepID=UPI00372D677F